MITDPKILEYMDMVSPVNSDVIEGIRENALKDYIPVLKRDTESLLKFILSIKEPQHILEVGCAVGYSACVMLENSDADIVTIEKMPERAREAKKNFEYAGFGERVRLIEGDADGILEGLLGSGEKFDLIFLDAAKAQYVRWLSTVKSLLNDGGILFSDNCLQEGDIAESAFAIRKRDRTIHRRMREYIYLVLHDKELKSGIYSVGDGVLLGRKIAAARKCKN